MVAKLRQTLLGSGAVLLACAVVLSSLITAGADEGWLAMLMDNCAELCTPLAQLPMYTGYAHDVCRLHMSGFSCKG